MTAEKDMNGPLHRFFAADHRRGGSGRKERAVPRTAGAGGAEDQRG
jgi:hypothetical protein